MDKLSACGSNPVGITPDGKYIINKTSSVSSSIITGPYLSTTSGPVVSNYSSSYCSNNIDMTSERGAGQEYIRKCVRDVLLDKDSFPEERQALLVYLQSVLFDMIEPENLEEIQVKFAGISLDADKKIKDLQEKLEHKETEIEFLQVKVNVLRDELDKAYRELDNVRTDYYKLRSNLPSIIREEVSRIINPRY